MTPAAFVLAVVFANIMSNPAMPQPAVRHDIRAALASRPNVACGNEIEPDRYKRAWRVESARVGLRTGAVGYPDPVALKSRPRAVYGRRLSRGVPHVSPDRWAVVVRGPGWAVVCTHLISQAWTSHPERRPMWRAEMRRVRAIVRRQHRAGRSVIVGGDLNTPYRVRWRYPGVVFLGNRYRMQAAAIPAPGWTARRVGGRTIPASRLGTDHPIIRRNVALEMRAGVG